MTDKPTLSEQARKLADEYPRSWWVDDAVELLRSLADENEKLAAKIAEIKRDGVLVCQDRENDQLKKELADCIDDRDKWLAKAAKLENELAEARKEESKAKEIASGHWNMLLALQKELAKARAEIERLSVYNHDWKTQHDLLKAERDAALAGCQHDDPSWCDPMKCMVPRRKMDEWKAKYEAAVEVAAELKLAIYERAKAPNLGISDMREGILGAIAAKLREKPGSDERAELRAEKLKDAKDREWAGKVADAYERGQKDMQARAAKRVEDFYQPTADDSIGWIANAKSVVSAIIALPITPEPEGPSTSGTEEKVKRCACGHTGDDHESDHCVVCDCSEWTEEK